MKRLIGGGGSGGGTPGGSDTQVQFNDGGAFGGDADLTWNKTTNVLGVTGDVNLSDGGTYTTTLQTITPTAARTISFPDATGTVGLVGGSSGNLTFNNAGAYAGVANSSVDNATGNITLGSRFISTVNGAADASPVRISGTWFAGTSANSLPALYVSPTGTAAGTSWATAGTAIGVNAPAAFAGNLLDLQVNGTTRFNVDRDGTVRILAIAPFTASTVPLRFGNPGGDVALGRNASDGLFYFYGAQTAAYGYVFTGARGEALRINTSDNLQFAEGKNIETGATTGTKIGTATTQKLGFYNKTPVVQPVAVADATTSVDVITQFNALLARMRDLGLIAT